MAEALGILFALSCGIKPRSPNPVMSLAILLAPEPPVSLLLAGKLSSVLIKGSNMLASNKRAELSGFSPFKGDGCRRPLLWMPLRRPYKPVQ
jgi:hypothetical protein